MNIRIAGAVVAAVVIVAALLSIYGINGNENGDEPGRPTPHALDQSN